MTNRFLVAAFMILILYSLSGCGNPPNNKSVTVDELTRRGDTPFSLDARTITEAPELVIFAQWNRQRRNGLAEAGKSPQILMFTMQSFR